MAEHPRGAVLRRAIETCISPDDDAIAEARRAVHRRRDRVVTEHAGRRRSPTSPRTSPFRESAFSDVDIQIDSLDIFGSRGLAEFRVAATFSGPFVIDEAAVIEPNGQQLLLGAAVGRRLRGRQDHGAPRATSTTPRLLEQMLDA